MNRLTYEEVKKYIENFGYKLLSNEYINGKTKLLVQCDKGHKYEVLFYNFQQGRRCPYCSKKHKYTYKEVKEYIEQFNYKLLSDEYINVNEPLLIQCDNNHEPYKANFHNFKHGKRCPICNISKGERKIINYLKENNIEYTYEKKFYGLIGVGGGNLSYDFYLPKYNLLIEYQGEQHEAQCGQFGDFERQQEHDKRKRDYVKDNGYNLLEIWYWDFDNIEEILEKYLK